MGLPYREEPPRSSISFVPDHCAVSINHPSSSSIGDPQFPIWTNSHGNCGFQDGVATVPGIQIIRIYEIEVFVILPGNHGVPAADAPGNSAMPLFLAAVPAAAIIRKDKNRVAINSI